MRPSDMNAVLSRVGLLFNGREEGQRRLLGACFCVVRADVFITAAHCLDEIPLDRLWINHHGGPDPHLFSQAKHVEFIRRADMAIVLTEAPGAKWVQPFRFVRFSAHLGQEVCALGYPIQQLDAAVPADEMFRFFRGHVQRPFLHRSPRSGGEAYGAYELSFPCPSGLSGGPVFLTDDPLTVIGVVTDDLEAGTTVREEVIEDSPRGVVHSETRRIINYGVAAGLLAAAATLESVLGEPLPTRH